MIFRQSLASLSFAAPALAAATEPLGFKTQPSVDIAQWLGGLIVVLAAMWLLLWGLRRVGSFSRLEAGRFQVLAALSLGSRERVVLLQVGDKQLLLGVAPGRVQTLCVLDSEEAIKVGAVVSAAGSDTPFAERLATLLQGKRS